MTTDHPESSTSATDIDSALLFWRNIALAVSKAPDCLPDLLADERERLIYRIHSTCPEGGWRAGESWFLAPCLRKV